MGQSPTLQSVADFWDQRYSGPRGLSFGLAPNVFLASQAHHFKPGQRALVPGDGEGRNGVWLAQQGLKVETVDASRNGVANARAFAAERGVEINAVAADLNDWNWPVGVYDAVVSIFLHFPSDVRAAMHTRMVKALAPGGIIVLTAYTPGQHAHHERGSVGGPREAAMLFTPEMLKSDFAGLTIEHLAEAEVALDEGIRHSGMSSVIHMVARQSR